MASRGGEGLNYIQKRLLEFNSRLEGMMDPDTQSTQSNKEGSYNSYKDEVKTLKAKLA